MICDYKSFVSFVNLIQSELLKLMKTSNVRIQPWSRLYSRNWHQLCLGKSDKDLASVFLRLINYDAYDDDISARKSAALCDNICNIMSFMSLMQGCKVSAHFLLAIPFYGINFCKNVITAKFNKVCSVWSINDEIAEMPRQKG